MAMMILNMAFLPMVKIDLEPYSSTSRIRLRRVEMLTLGLFARLEAKPGKEEEVAAFLKQGLQLADQETTTPLWFAVRLGQTTFAIFDAFLDEAGRQAHLNGPIAKALMANAPNLLATTPVIERLDVLGAKLPK
jgi:quinol monooxygenase YgiN